MLRSALRGDHKCMFFSLISIVLFLSSLSFVSAESYVERVYGTCHTDELTYESWRNIYFDYARNTEQDNGLYYNTADFQEYYFGMWDGNTPNGGRIVWSEDGGGGTIVNCSKGCEKNSDPYGNAIYDGYWGFQHFGCLTEDCNLQNNLFRDIIKNQVEVKCTGNRVKFSYNNLFYEGPYSEPGDTEISCWLDMHYTEIWSEIPEEYNCAMPLIENLTIYPEYDSEEYVNRTNLTYEEIFPNNKLKPYINLTIKYSDGSEPDDDERFMVNYTINFTYPSESIVPHGGIFRELPEETIECSKNCIIEIPEKFKDNYQTMDQDTLISVKAKVFYDAIETDEKSTKRYTPYFNIKADKFIAMNVIEDPEKILVENKPIGVRAWFYINSSIRKINNDGSITLFDEYIDSVTNARIDLIFDDDYVKTVFWNLIRYSDENELINIIKNVGEEMSKRRDAMIRLWDYKRAKETVNIQELFPPKDKIGAMKITIKSDAWGELNEFNIADNSMFEDYTLKRQYKPLNVMYLDVSILSGSSVKKTGRTNEDIELISSNAFNFLIEAFPFDPTKINPKNNGREAVSNFPVYIDTGLFTTNSERAQTFIQLQKLADTIDVDIVYGLVNGSIFKEGVLGLTSTSIARKVALIHHAYPTPDNYLHETGHLFAYPTEEPSTDPSTNSCDDPENKFFMPSADGWCLDQTTGKPCYYFGVVANPWGINKVIFDWPDSRGCYDTFDNPKEVDTSMFPPAPTMLANIKPDIMNSKQLNSWMSRFTYNKLKSRFLLN